MMSATFADIVRERRHQLIGQYLSCNYGSTPSDVTHYSWFIYDIKVIANTVVVVTNDAFRHPIVHLFPGSINPLEHIMEHGDIWFSPTSDFSTDNWCIYRSPLGTTFISSE